MPVVRGYLSSLLLCTNPLACASSPWPILVSACQAMKLERTLSVTEAEQPPALCWRLAASTKCALSSQVLSCGRLSESTASPPLPFMGHCGLQSSCPLTPALTWEELSSHVSAHLSCGCSFHDPIILSDPLPTPLLRYSHPH